MPIRRILVVSLWLSLIAASAWAETPAPSVHWGAIAYPDQERTLTTGLTLNRFTQFDGAGKQYNDINQTMGFNFASVSWTERWAQLPGWSTNLTLGIGPTDDKLTRFLQNDVIHKIRGLDPVPVGAKREALDYMVSGTLTKWTPVFGQREDGFAGVGIAMGSLYQEPYAQAGLRRVSLSDVFHSASGNTSSALQTFSNWVRFSAMGRYGRLYGGSAFPVIAPQSYLGQFSVSAGDYRASQNEADTWEVELALTVDSGLFVDRKGDALEERFVSVAFRYSFVSFETWNDLINQKDYGPSYGARLTIDLLRLYDRWKCDS